MNFSIVSDTAGARVGELARELRKILEDKINDSFKEYDVSIGFAIRCLPVSYNRRSFVRFTKKDNDLTIDFCVDVEEYKKLYKIEQRFHLGNEFLHWLDKGLSNKKFIEFNPKINKENFLTKVKELGKVENWFKEEVDYSEELEF